MWLLFALGVVIGWISRSSKASSDATRAQMEREVARQRELAKARLDLQREREIQAARDLFNEKFRQANTRELPRWILHLPVQAARSAVGAIAQLEGQKVKAFKDSFADTIYSYADEPPATADDIETIQAMESDIPGICRGYQPFMSLFDTVTRAWSEAQEERIAIWRRVGGLLRSDYSESTLVFLAEATQDLRETDSKLEVLLERYRGQLGRLEDSNWTLLPNPRVWLTEVDMIERIGRMLRSEIMQSTDEI